MSRGGFEVLWAERAIRDLEQIVDFISQEAPLAAQRLFDHIAEKSCTLDSLPYRGRVVPELARLRTLQVRGGTEKARACALEVHALTEEGAPWALEVHGRALKVHGRALEVRLWPHEFFPRALFGARCIPFGEGSIPKGTRPSLSGARPAHSRARRAPKRDATFPLEGASIPCGDGTVPFEGATGK